MRFGPPLEQPPARSAVPRLVALAAMALVAAWAATQLLGGGDAPRRPSPLVPAVGPGSPTATTGTPSPGKQEAPAPFDDPFAYDPDRRAEFERRAAAGFAHPLYAKSPGGVVAAATRTARYRPIIDDVARETGFDADTMEGIVLLESAGLPEAGAGDVHAATGLTQILAETGQNLLGMRIDTAESRRLTRRIARADRRGRTAEAARLRARRRVVDERYDPEKAIRAMGSYLSFARGELEREDLAVASYHMGVGNLQNVLKAFGADDDTPYAELYFDSSPLRHARAWAILSGLGDDSSTYLWRVGAAKDIMRRFRRDAAALGAHAALMTSKNSAEEVLHPPGSTEVFAGPARIRAALASGALTPLPVAGLQQLGVRTSAGMGELARRLEQPRELYRGLRPEALALLVYLARGVESIGRQRPLWLTSTVRDRRYQQQLVRSNPEATHNYSLHTTGWAMDLSRRYRNRAHALAVQFMLDRLTALNLIAWVREPAAIHLTVSSDAEALLPLLRPADEDG